MFGLINFLLTSAPVCPKPPDAPADGVQEHLPIPIGLEPYNQCAVSEDEMSITCSSFLSIYITEVSYGRDSATKREMCGGDSPSDFQSLGSGTCYDDAYNSQLQGEIASECHGTYNCTFHVPTTPLTEDCDGLKREIKVNYTCGEYFWERLTTIQILLKCFS